MPPTSNNDSKPSDGLIPSDPSTSQLMKGEHIVRGLEEQPLNLDAVTEHAAEIARDFDQLGEHPPGITSDVHDEDIVRREKVSSEIKDGISNTDDKVPNNEALPDENAENVQEDQSEESPSSKRRRRVGRAAKYVGVVLIVGGVVVAHRYVANQKSEE